MKKLNDNFLDPIHRLKYLSNSISVETKNSLSPIISTCETIRNNLEKTIEMLYSISDSACRFLLAIDIALQNANIDEIDKSKFVDLSIAEVVDNAIAKYLFNGDEEMALLNVDLSDDFIFKGDEVLMSFVVLNLLKNSLVHKAKINIWLDEEKRCLYFKDNRADKVESDIGLSFCKRVMQAFDGDIACKSSVGKGTEFCLRFE